MTIQFSSTGDGGSPITGWVIRRAEDAAFTVGVVDTPSTGTSVLTLTPGKKYGLRLLAATGLATPSAGMVPGRTL